MPNFFRLIFVYVILIFLSNCKEKPPVAPNAELISTLLNSYTRGIVTSNTVFKYVFNSDIVNEDQIGQNIDKKLLTLSPAVDGITFWESRNTLVFKPAEKLKPGTKYSVSVDLKSIAPALAKDLETLDYTIQTREMAFVVNPPDVSLANDNTFSVSGQLQLSDELEDAQIEKLLTASQNTTNLKINWEHHPESLYSKYSIDQIQKSKATEIKLAWDGASLGLKNSGNHIIKLPAQGTFAVLGIKYENNPQNRVVTSFSENLKSNQNIDGLIAIKGKQGLLRNVIDGNKIYSYFNSPITGDVQLDIFPGILTSNNIKFSSSETHEITIAGNDPMVRFVGKGNIIPQSNEIILPFEAIGLKAVDIEVFKIFDHNILQFLQMNNIGENYELYRVGRLISQKKIELTNTGTQSNITKWAHYAIDLSPLIKTEPNAIYQIRIGFRPSYTALDCAQNMDETDNSGVELVSFYDENYYGHAGYYSGYRWEDRDDPCKAAFYNMDHFIARNVLVSNLGIIGKVSDKNIFTAVTDLRTTDPISGATVEVYNFQLEKIAELTTNAEGIAQQTVSQTPYAIVVVDHESKGYLRLVEGSNLNTSAFDIEGQEVQKGMKGYIYGERGVWRPGDSLHLSFILNDNNSKLPAGHPVQLKLFDPQGKLMAQQIVNNPTGSIYSFPLKTSPDDITGTWRATVTAGGAVFSKSLMIEAIKPNRLKINFDAGDEIQSKQNTIALKASWLTGLNASGLTAKVTSKWSQDNTPWPAFKGFSFQDPARTNNSMNEQVLFDGKLNDQGEANVPLKISKDFKPSGKMKVRFNIEVSEPAGDFSTYSNSSSYHPYNAYAGVRLPDDQWGYKTLNINSPSTVQLTSIDTKGNALANKKLTVGLYELEWRWWWEQRDNAYADYSTSDHKNALQKGVVTTNANGLAEWKVNVNHWGRYLIRVCDTESGHCSGDFAYAGWPENGDESNHFDMATLIKLQTDKEKYSTTETVKLNIPAPALSKMLITLENGSKVIESHWVTVDKSPFIFSFQATPQMAPAIYAHVSLIQQHGFVGNDLPMRMYGILPIYIENGESKLLPKINTVNIFKPDKTEIIEISESNGKSMSYTLDIVDDGLLDLTNFKTPDPYTQFFSKEALGVRTWDVYDQVMGAFGGKLESVLSVGGDEGLLTEKSTATNRFKSPVIHMGPFLLKKGEKKKHEIQIQNYVGSVRIMAVAADENAYGNAELTVQVKSALMILPTAPRVMSIGEKITMPVNLFITDPSLKNVTINAIDKKGTLKFSNSIQSVSIDKAGEQIVYFTIDAPQVPGKSTIVVEAKSGNEIARNEIEMETRNPNPYATDVKTVLVEAGATKTISISSPESYTNVKSLIEVATFEPVNMSKYLDDLIQYPYGCSEQTVSAAFPQLYLDQMVSMQADQLVRTKNNVKEAIAKLSKFSKSDGSFSLWPDAGSYTDSWVTSYIGHFMVEAQKGGYKISDQLLSKWKEFQKKTANIYDPSQKSLYAPNHGLDQAYRLYTMALAGIPDLGAMNRLKEYGPLGINAKWRLAATYALVGQKETANSLITKSPDLSDYSESGYTYGSPIRDQAMILETYMLTGDNTKAFNAAIELTKQLNTGRPWNTQGLAYALQVLARFKGGQADGKNWNFKYQVDNQSKQSVSVKSPSFLLEPTANAKSAKQIVIENTSGKPLYVQSTIRGQQLKDTKGDEANGLKITVNYKDDDNNLIDPSLLKKGDHIHAEISIAHLGNPARDFNNLALTHIIPAGWEIINDRITGNSKSQNYTYQDVRDDRVFTFFKLRPGETKTMNTFLRATYTGSYILPAIACEEMYDAKINARKSGGF
ncbi:MAG: MG2 domain-containing protein, partial [Saprospiraceae bacterium]